MCDYSLCGIPNRLAVEREELVVYRFSTGRSACASPPIRECVNEIRKAVRERLLASGESLL